jgi:hypothetical protein
MKRNYTHIKKLLPEIQSMVSSGMTQREIAEHYGFKDKYVVKEFLKRERRLENKVVSGILPRRRGRPPKGYVPTEQEQDNEIRRLKMENDLLRSFLRLAGRR